MEPLYFIYWGAYGVSLVPPIAETAGWVPDNEVWWIQAAAVSIEVPSGQPQLPPGDYIIHDDTRYAATGALWYMTALAKAQQTATTPTVALNRPHLLLPGHRLNARTNIPMPSYARMGICATGLKFPIADLPKLLGLVDGQGVATPTPDFTAMIAAAQQASAALAALAESTP